MFFLLTVKEIALLENHVLIRLWNAQIGWTVMKEEIEELVKESLSNNGLKKKVIKEQELEAMVDDDEEVIDMDDEGGDEGEVEVLSR